MATPTSVKEGGVLRGDSPYSQLWHRNLITYVLYMTKVLAWDTDPDTTVCESSHAHRNSSLDFSCAPTHDSARGFNSSLFTILAAPSHLAIYQPTGAISCHVTECRSVIGLHSTVQWNSLL